MMNISKNYKKYIWYSLIIFSILFCLPFFHKLFADLIINLTHSSHTNERWIRRFQEYAFRPLFLVVLIPLLYKFFNSQSFKNISILKSDEITIQKLSIRELLFIGLSTFIIITLTTTSSFLYPFNLWNDSNIIYTVGKGIVHGFVPYRDFFERKGILFYFIHTLGYLISPDKFTGIYILELFPAFFFLLLCYKTAKLFTNKDILFFIPIFAALIYSAYNTKSGDCAEEFCLPLLMYPFYISLKNLKLKKDFNCIELFICGLLAGCVFWIKYTMVGFFIGWAIIPLYDLIRNKKFKSLILLTAALFAGIIISTLPWIIYFSRHHAIKDWLETYILSLMNGSTTTGGGKTSAAGIIKAYLKNIPSMIHYNLHLFIFSLAGFIYIFKKEAKNVKIHIVLTFIFTYLFIFYKGIFQRYYCMILDIFAVFGLVLLAEAFELLIVRCSFKHLKESVFIFFFLVLAILYSVENYIYIGFMTTKIEDYPQYKFTKIINKYENPSILTYKFMDRGFYTISNRLPNCKYFFEMSSDSEAQKKYAEDWVKDGKVDFIITEDEKYDLDNYTLISEEKLLFNYGRYFEDTDYYLYKNNRLHDNN